MKLKSIVIFLLIVLVIKILGNNLLSQDQSIHDIQNDTTRINLLIEKGIELQTSKPDSALYFFNEAISMASRNYTEHKRFKELEAYALRLAGLVNWQSGNNELAINQYMRVEEIFIEIDARKELSDNYNRLGMIHASQSNYFESKVLFNQSLLLGIELDDSSMIARAYGNIGLVNWSIGFYDKALEAFMKALSINEKLDDVFIMAGNHNNIGNLHNSMGNPEKAIEYYYKSLEIALKLDAKQQIAGSYINIGASLMRISKNAKDKEQIIEAIDKAINYYNKALQICMEINDNRTSSISYNNLGSSYHDKALLAEKVSNKVNYLNRAIENYKESIRIKELMGDKSGV